MNRIHEVMKQETLLLPQSQTAGANTTGTYKSVVDGVEDVQFLVQAGALAEGKKLTVEVFQADDGSGTNAAEITACETVFTAPTGGATSARVLISLDKSKMSKPYATVKVTNDAASAVQICASMQYEATGRGTGLNTVDGLTVV